MAVSLDVDTTSTLDACGLHPVQSLDTDGTTVVNGAECLRNSNWRGSAELLAKVNLTSVLPVQSRTKNNRRDHRKDWNTQPHVTGVDESSDRVQVEVSDHIGSQGVECKVTLVHDRTRGNGHRGSQTVGRGNVKRTFIVQVSSEGCEHVVNDREVHIRYDIEISDLQVDRRHQYSVLRDGKRAYTWEV